jgi:GNAT superfamily N-acetyltransferase
MLVTTVYLEQLSPSSVRDARPPAEPVSVVQVERPSPEFSRFLYLTVGGDWHWTDRLGWTRTQWHDYLTRPQVETWVAWVRGAPAGYIELAGAPDLSVEIAYFGLLPGSLGLGLGGHLLSQGLHLAWSLGSRWSSPAVTRVWVHTCSLDGPAALANYQARGMTIYRSEETTQDVPAAPMGSWPHLSQT